MNGNRNKVWALMIVGSDDDIVGYTIEHLLGEGIDKILIDLVPVEDNTAEIVRQKIAKYPNSITVYPSDSIEIWGSRRMTRLAQLAYEQGVELVLPCDSDELFYSKNGNPLADEMRESKGWVVACPIFMHLASTIDDSFELNPYRKMIHKECEPLRLHKIFLRYNPKMMVSEGNHSAQWSGGDVVAGSVGNVEMRHFPYRSPEQFVKKVQITEKAMLATKGYPKTWGVHYRVYAETLHKAGAEALKEWYERWFFLGSPISEEQRFVKSPAPYKGDE